MANRLENTGLDIKGALDAVKKAAAEVREEAAAREPAGSVKFVNVRFREADHTRIGQLAVGAGMTKAAFCKMASLYVAELVEAGAFSIGGGGIIERNR